MFYLVTIKRNAIEFTSKRDLIIKMKLMFRRVTITHYCVELDSLRRLHLHAIVQFNKKPYYKRYMDVGWHIYFCEIDKETEDVVIRYISKHQNDNYQNEMEILSYAQYHYMFED